MTDDVLASVRAGAENLDRLRDDVPRALARMRAAGCAEALVRQYQPLIERIVALFENLEGAINRGDAEATVAIGERMQIEQTKLVPLVQSIWKSAKPPQA
ncbi:MAG TPA: hypothetical protein VFX89_10890 [Gammaproteobacteria bacterium]|nr:hypothetical protein [Gammaproteobacteria bacterium]